MWRIRFGLQRGGLPSRFNRVASERFCHEAFDNRRPPVTRRAFLQSCAGAGLAAGVRADAASAVGTDELARLLDQPVLDVSFVKQPVKVASVELLRTGRVYLVRTRSTDGVEAVTVPNPAADGADVSAVPQTDRAGVHRQRRARLGTAAVGRVSPRQQLQAAGPRPMGVRSCHRDVAAGIVGPNGPAAAGRFLRRDGAAGHPDLRGQRQPGQSPGSRDRAPAEAGRRVGSTSPQVPAGRADEPQCRLAARPYGSPDPESARGFR